MRNLQEQVKKAFVTKNYSDLSLFEQIVLVISKVFTNSRPSASNFKSFSQSLEQFFLTVGQNNFGNKRPFTSEEKERHPIPNFAVTLSKHSKLNLGFKSEPSLN